MDKFIPLNVSSKFGLCGLPLTVDSYKNCSFGCKYCFANCRKIMAFKKELKVANVDWMKNKLKKIYEDNEFNKNNFLDMLLKEKITWHWGGLSDPFQPIEKELKITSQMLGITNKYDVSILFSTKTDDVYDWNKLNPELHSFQLSISNLDNRRDIEPEVPNIEKRIKFFRFLKYKGFKVGIRIQPFIPNISNEQIVDTFREADYFTIEGLKLVPQDKEQIDEVTSLTRLNKKDFVNLGLFNLRPNIRLKFYKKTIERLENYGIPYSIADNDLHYMTKSKCCCGEPLIKKSTDFNNTAMFFENKDYGLDNIKNNIGCFKDCKANHLFASNRQEKWCITVWDFFKERFNRKSCPFSKKFMYGFVDNGQTKLADKNRRGRWEMK